MEFLTIFLSALLAIVSPVGLITDSLVENALRSRLDKVEQLQVRIDNAPNYQLVQGKVERVRFAGRGLWLTPEIRIDALDLETDPINVNVQRLRQSPRDALQQPLQAGVRLVLTESDINQALQSPAVAERLQQVGSRLLGGSPERYQFFNPRVEFLGSNRLRIQVDVQDRNETLAIIAESGLTLVAGQRLQLINPVVSVNGSPLPPPLVAGLAQGVSDRINLRSLAEAGIIARLLQLDITLGELALAAFVRVDAVN